MKINKITIITIVCIIFFSSVLSTNVIAGSDKTSMEVKSRMLTDEKIPIIVILKDVSSFKTHLKENGVYVLKNKTASTQHNIAVLLNGEKKRNKADKIKQFWIANAIAVNASPELIEQLSSRDDVESIELDSKVHMIEDYSVNVVTQGQIDNATTEIKRINATKAWEIGIDGTGINVSVIDTGIYANHPDISGRVIKWVDYVSGLGSPYDDNGHGTHVAGTVGGNGTRGTTTGVAPNTSLFGVKVLDGTGSGYESDVIRGIQWSIDNGANIISLSLGSNEVWTTQNCDVDNIAMSTAINNAISSGIVFVAAAGNDPSGVTSPGCIKNVIAVGNVYINDVIHPYSGKGGAMTDHGVVAPGVGITSLYNLNSGYTIKSGTSMATPHVSGTVALMIQKSRIHNITLTPSQIKNILANTSLDLGTVGKDNIFGAGRIDTYNATLYINNIDTTPPSVIANPTEYQTGQAAKNSTIITFNVTISDDYGVKNASVNVSAINNSLSSISLSNSGGFWKGNVTVSAIDGTYLLNVTAYDLSNSINNTTQILVIVDNTPSSKITIYPVVYQHGNATKLGDVIVFNFSAVFSSSNGVSSGIKNASLNVSAINNTGWISLINNSGFWKVNVTFDKSIIDGNYSLNVSFSDNVGNINNSMQVNISVDNTPPVINELLISSAFINLTYSINITVNITSSDNVSQVNRSELFARVTYPNGTSIEYNLSAGGGSLFYKNFTDTGQYGRYNVMILANDTTGNINGSQRIQFVTTYMKNQLFVTGANAQMQTIDPYSNTTLHLFTNNTSIGMINISRSKVNLTSNALGVTNPGIYVLVNASESIRNNLSYVIISVNYTDEEVSPYVESSLRLYRWNISSSSWDKLSGAGSYPDVNNAGVDTVNNFVWANLTYLGEFTVMGDIYVPPPPQSQRGGGGGGGGGASGENYSNIEFTEKHDLSIYKDKVTLYRFTNNNNPIEFVNVIGYVNFGDITTSVEVLRNTSTMVKLEPPGIIYKNANIWVGSSSFNSPRNIKTGTIRFRVLNKWIKENNIVSVRMVKWNKIDWEYLETNEFSKDDLFTYYDAFAQVFSNFAITGTIKENEKISEVKEIISVNPVELKPAQSLTPGIEPTELTKKNPDFRSILAILCLWGVYILRRGSNKS